MATKPKVVAAPEAPPVEPAREPFHISIVSELDENLKLTGGTFGILELMRLLNRTRVPREHMLPLAVKLRKFAKKARIYPPLLDAANRLEAEHERQVQ